MAAEKLPISVSVISFNESTNIPRMLASVADFASEIVVVDSHSTDDTRDIAASFGARVYEEDWKGHVAQKNSALEKCTKEWVLALDCDEVVTPELAASIRKTIEEDVAGGVLNRRTFYLGRLLKRSWQPDRKLRLVRRSNSPRWGGIDPHDALDVDGPAVRLEGDLLHYSFADVRDHFLKTVNYARISAGNQHERGRRFSLFACITAPPLTFIKKYLLKGGFIDGAAGFIVAASASLSSFLKLAFLWEIDFAGQNMPEPVDAPTGSGGSGRLPLSVHVISLNESERIGRALDAVHDIASEIVVVDSGSTDDTVAIAERFGARVFPEEWKGHVEQKNSALAKCTEPYSLNIDCDEVITDELKASIVKAVNDGSAAGYCLNRRTAYLGRLLKRSWQPDEKIRLVRMDANPRWEGRIIHESLKVDGRVERLPGEMVHYSFRGVQDHFMRTVNYAHISARANIEKGRRFRMATLVFGPPLTFFKKYVMKRGLVDGVPGLIAAASAAVYAMLKYSFIHEHETVHEKDGSS